MVNKGMRVAYCIGGRRGDNDHGPTDTEDDGASPRPELLRAVDFYASILAMAAHDLRQPLQAIVSALELLSRRITEGPAQAHLERGEKASAQLMEKLEQLADALSSAGTSARLCRSRFGSRVFFTALRSSSTDQRGARVSISVRCRRVP
jgi:signal transduction histidine kinase